MEDAMGIHHTHKAQSGERSMKKAAKLAAKLEKAKARQIAKEEAARAKAHAEGRPYIPNER